MVDVVKSHFGLSHISRFVGVGDAVTTGVGERHKLLTA